MHDLIMKPSYSVTMMARCDPVNLNIQVGNYQSKLVPSHGFSSRWSICMVEIIPITGNTSRLFTVCCVDGLPAKL